MTQITTISEEITHTLREESPERSPEYYDSEFFKICANMGRGFAAACNNGGANE